MSQEKDSKTAAGDPAPNGAEGIADGIADGIAVVAMAGRFPGASDIEALWEDLCAGVESITFFSREELEAAGVDPALLDDPRYVPARAVLDDIDRFDAPFFGFGARDAELMDPQLRLFLETCWEVIERAGYDTETWRGSIGVFGGMGMSGYLLHNLLTHPRLIAEAGALQIRILNDANYLVAQAAYRLNLTGPSLAVQTACSTSLVATCVACQSLLNYQCDAALAGGVLVSVPQRVGYLVQSGVTSPDGHCRAFDAAAQGAVEGSGVGVVMLKRLADALADGDRIHAVIKGFATNNDGSSKASFTAPGVDGQVEVVAMAQALAGVDPATVTYVEAHGTGTPLGDPIEVAALAEVFGAATDQKGFCALGSIKTNIGHLDAAAGIAGLIKTVLAAERGVIPASLNFQAPNPQIDFANSPFYVNAETRAWTPPAGVPRRAGVSAFALGGANAHVVVEEPPAVAPGDAAPAWQLLVLSARTEAALEAATGRLIDHLKNHPELDGPDGSGFADLAFTLQAGRRAFPYRRTVVCRGREDAIAALERRDPRRVLTGWAEPREGVAFLLSGLGNQHAGMARGLHEQIPAFAAHLDEVSEALRPHLGEDERRALFKGAEEAEGEGLDFRALVGRSGPGGEAGRLARTALAQPALFAVEVALARLLMDWGLRPQALLGFSLGEYTAAHLAGVLALPDAARLVAGRARLIDELPAGAMLAVPLPETDVRTRLSPDLSISAIAGPALTIVAGPEAAVAALEENLSKEGLTVRRLQTTHAFHSTMMEPAVARLRELLRGVELRAPEIPYLSNVTGTWITAEQATDP
ncbi:MAG TPA: type I polyketide synthase, partial [Thermoanaerobaculia bacterium]|nr:type I polyketide synthase [Thermoanaerobaculia bacterium]